MAPARRYALLLQPLLGTATGYAHSILRNRHDADDAVQQAALRGLERLRSYDESRPFKAWWFAILRNCCIDLLRHRKSSDFAAAVFRRFELRGTRREFANSRRNSHVTSASGAQSTQDGTMKPIEPEELSAFIDGELDADRMREVQTVMASDPALRQALNAIAGADAEWRLAAKSARFELTVKLPTRWLPPSPALTCAAVVLLLVIRTLPKLSDAAALSFLVQLPVLIALMIWVVVLARGSPDAVGRRAI